MSTLAVRWTYYQGHVEMWVVQGQHPPLLDEYLQALQEGELHPAANSIVSQKDNNLR